VQFFGAVTKKQPYMIITELMQGGSLADMLREAEFPDMRRAVELAQHMARGMNYLHNRTPQVCVGVGSRRLALAWGRCAGGQPWRPRPRHQARRQAPLTPAPSRAPPCRRSSTATSSPPTS
jgi:hypothetical protein